VGRSPSRCEYTVRVAALDVVPAAATTGALHVAHTTAPPRSITVDTHEHVERSASGCMKSSTGAVASCGDANPEKRHGPGARAAHPKRRNRGPRETVGARGASDA
jgi:hypothetical protein